MHRLGFAEPESSTDEDEDQRDLQPGGGVLKLGGHMDAAHVDQGHDPDHDEGPSRRGCMSCLLYTSRCV